MSEFSDKVVLVTGASSGVGLSIAEYFSSAGARVFCAQRTPSPRFESIRADLSQPESAMAVIEQLERQCSSLDVLVNNAGIMMQSSIAATSLEQWQQSLMVNLTAPFLLMQAALPLLEASKGSIVNIASIEALTANPLHTAYCSAKAGLIGMTKATAVDLGEVGIRCNAVAPGWIDTDLNEAFIESQDNPQAFRQRIAGIHPLRRTGKAEDVANLVGFLASSRNHFITGQVYTIDGGRTATSSLP